MAPRARQGAPLLHLRQQAGPENTDFFETLSILTNALGKECVPLQVPLGAAQDLQGVANLLAPSGELPEVAQEARERLVEAVAENDDELATKYLEGEELTEEELTEGLRRAVSAGQLVPVLAGSGDAQRRRPGAHGRLGRLCALSRDAASGGGSRANGAEEELAPAGRRPLAALVFKTTADQYVGRLSFIRVYSGTLASDSEVSNSQKEQVERVGQLFVPQGKEQHQVPHLVAGEIGAVGRLAATSTGDTLSQRDRRLTLDGVDFPSPPYAMAVYPKAKADTDKLTTALNRLVEEDPSLQFTREADTGEALLVGLGDSHLALAIQRAQRKLGANLLLQAPRVPYKETLSAVARVEHRYKQQSGGHGHFAHVAMRLEPLDRGIGVEFTTEVVGGSVPKDFIPAVEKGVRRACAEGVLAGFPVVDIRAILYDGSFHPVDSATLDFDIAGYYGLKKGFLDGSPALVEPVMLLRVSTPDSYTGDIIGDLNSKRGRILGMVPQSDGNTIVEGHVASCGDTALRSGPAVTDPGAGHLHRRVRPLRGSPRPPGAADHWRDEGTARA